MKGWLLGLLLAVCAGSRIAIGAEAGVPPEISRYYAEMAKAFNEKNAAGGMRYWAPDCVIVERGKTYSKAVYLRLASERLGKIDRVHTEIQKMRTVRRRGARRIQIDVDYTTKSWFPDATDERHTVVRERDRDEWRKGREGWRMIRRRVLEIKARISRADSGPGISAGLEGVSPM